MSSDTKTSEAIGYVDSADVEAFRKGQLSRLVIHDHRADSHSDEYRVTARKEPSDAQS